MTHVLSLGAINKNTGDYVYPKIANKKDEYRCPGCKKDLILCQGQIRNHYFRHKVDSVNPCHRYSNPTETQIHEDAKMLMENLLKRKTPISFSRNCCCCKKKEEFEIPEISETSTIKLEHRFNYKGEKQADVAYLDAGEIVCLFEICYTHKTSSENRPEPWFEIDAETLIKLANDTSLSQIQIPCIRCEKCDDCIENDKITIEKEIEECNYNSNTKIARCSRCNKKEQIWLMQTNRISTSVCKSCDIELFSKDVKTNPDSFKPRGFGWGSDPFRSLK